MEVTHRLRNNSWPSLKLVFFFHKFVFNSLAAVSNSKPTVWLHNCATSFLIAASVLPSRGKFAYIGMGTYCLYSLDFSFPLHFKEQQ
jgi:hypothetical protein